MSGTLEEKVLRSPLTTRDATRAGDLALRVAAAILGIAVAAGCAATSRTGGGIGAEVVDPAVRAVRVDTTGCGYASDHFGSGVVVGDGLIITVAHLIVQAEGVTVSVADSSPAEVTVAAVDLQRDLAAIRFPETKVSQVETAIADTGTKGLIVGAAASGSVRFEVKRRVNLKIEDVLGTERHSRLGYEVSAVTTDGDSGAGAYDEGSRLVGIVFATGKDGATSWLTASDEVEDFLTTVGPAATYELCR